MQLTAKQMRLFEALFGRAEVSARELYLHLGYDPAKVDVFDGRRRSYAQASLTGPIARLNARLKAESLKVAPGKTPRTYRLCRIND